MININISVEYNYYANMRYCSPKPSEAFTPNCDSAGWTKPFWTAWKPAPRQQAQSNPTHLHRSHNNPPALGAQGHMQPPQTLQDHAQPASLQDRDLRRPPPGPLEEPDPDSRSPGWLPPRPPSPPTWADTRIMTAALLLQRELIGGQPPLPLLLILDCPCLELRMTARWLLMRSFTTTWR